jgi:membrane fusion protein, macrolide-specific efflux system
MNMTRIPTRWAWVALAAVVVMSTIAWSRSGARAAAQDPSTVPVVRGDIEDTVSALGSIQPLEFVDVGTQVPGQLKHLHVKVGDSVAQGAIVAEIDTAVLTAKVDAGQATLQSLSAQIAERQAQLALASRQHKRNATMFAQDAVSRDALDTTRVATQVTSAQVSALKAQRQQTAAILRIDQTNLAYAKVHAPMAGTVVALNARQGQTLNTNQQAPILMRLARLDTMTVVTQVSEADVVRVAPGTEVYFNTLGRPDRRWSAKVRQILPTPETLNNVVLYNVLFDVDNADRQLMTQMSAQVSFVLSKAKQTLLVPVSALSDTRDAKGGKSSDKDREKNKDKRTARVRVSTDGGVEDREVVLGVTTRLMAQVVSGLTEGERVIVANAEGKPDGKSKDTTKPKDTAKRTAKL